MPTFTRVRARQPPAVEARASTIALLPDTRAVPRRMRTSGRALRLAPRTWPTSAIATARFRVTGVTLDASGAPLATCTVALLRAGSLELVSRNTSDGSGNYELTSPDNAGNFLVVSLRPDGTLAGVTRPILVAIGY